MTAAAESSHRPWPGCKPVIASASGGHESWEACRLNSDREEESGLILFPRRKKTESGLILSERPDPRATAEEGKGEKGTGRTGLDPGPEAQQSG
jgi:hypothetical protein